MTGRQRWGILGTGIITHIFVQDLRRAGREVVAVASRDEGRASAIASGLGVPRAHCGHDALVRDPEVDIVYVATPHSFHAEHACSALEAGKHVLVEKPFTLNHAEALRVAALANDNGLVAFEAMWTRWLPHMREIKRVIEAGAIGEPRFLMADNGMRLATDPEHRIQDPELGGGALLDLGVYPISFAQDLFGVPEEIRGNSRLTVTGVDGQVAVLLSYSGGRQALSHSTIEATSACRASIVGTEGRVEIDPHWYTATGFTLFDSNNRVVTRFENAVEGRGMQYQALAMEEAIRGPRAHYGDDAIRAASVMKTLDVIRSEIGVVYPGDLR